MKNKTRKSLSLLLALVMLLSVLPFAGVTAVAADSAPDADVIIGDDLYDFTVDYDWDWDEETDEEVLVYYAEITGTAESLSGDVVVPSTLGGYPVRRINYAAFKDRTEITSLVIPESVEIVSGDEDEGGAFQGCTALESVEFKGEDTYIGIATFRGCTALKNVTLPKKLSGISMYLFYGCTALEEITLPETLGYIGEAAFFNCKSLKNIDIPDRVTHIGDVTFYGCTALESVDFPKGYTEDGEQYYLREIYDCAFEYCTSLKSINIPYGVIDIGYAAFYGCESAETVTLPAGITGIGEGAFYNTAFYKNEDNWEGNALYIGTYLIDTENIYGSYSIKSGTTLIAEDAFSYSNITNVTFPSSLEYIGSDAFEGCDSLGNFTLPTGLKNIGSCAFAWCEALTAVSIPAGIESINSCTFYDCVGLSSLEIGEGIKSIGNQAFEGCDSLKSVNIPKSVEGINPSAFVDCQSLTTFTVDSANTSYFASNGILCEYHYNSDWDYNEDTDEWERTDELLDDYTLVCYPAGKTASEFSVPSDVTEIDDYAFSYNGSLATVTMTDNVEFIGDNIFHNCKKLKNVTLSKTITYISSYAFSECSALEEIDIPENVWCIWSDAFSGCTSLKKVELPESVTRLGSWAFAGCTALESFTFPSSEKISYIDYYCFDGCTSLKNITLPYGIEEIYDCAFYGCTALEEITIPVTVETIEENAFYDCTSLKKATIYAGVEEIGDYAFGYHTAQIYDEEWDDWYGKSNTPVDGFTVYGFTGTLAQEYAEENGFAFVSIDDTHVHLFGEWEESTAPTVVTKGEEKRFCPGCAMTQTREIDMLPSKEVTNEQTGITLVYPEDYADWGTVSVSAEQKTDGAAFDALNAEKSGQKTLFDISMYIDDEKLSAEDMYGSPVWVKVPLPENYDPTRTNVYYVNDEGKLEKVKSFVEGDFVFFEAEHFSNYAIVEEEAEPEPQPEPTNPSANCNHICHKGGIKKVVYKVLRIFWKLFKTKKYCSCGARHY